MASSLYFSFANQYSLGGGFPFSIVLVPRYKLSLFHTSIKPDLLGFPGIGVFACGLRDHVIMRFASLLVHELIFVGRFLFLIVLVPRYNLYLCHTPIKPDLLGILGIWCLCMWVA